MFDQSGIGRKVHSEILSEYPADLLAEGERLTAWLTELAEEYPDRLHIRVTDLQSGLGFLKAVRYWARRTPAFIINGRKRYAGWDRDALEAIVRQAVAARGEAEPPHRWPLADF